VDQRGTAFSSPRPGLWDAWERSGKYPCKRPHSNVAGEYSLQDISDQALVEPPSATQLIYASLQQPHTPVIAKGVNPQRLVCIDQYMAEHLNGRSDDTDISPHKTREAAPRHEMRICIDALRPATTP
jgi:hypothetical protein